MALPTIPASQKALLHSTLLLEKHARIWFTEDWSRRWSTVEMVKLERGLLCKKIFVLNTNKVMTEYYTNSVNGSGRPNYTVCNLGLLNMSLYWGLSSVKSSCFEFHHNGLLKVVHWASGEQHTQLPVHSRSSDGGVSSSPTAPVLSGWVCGWSDSVCPPDWGCTRWTETSPHLRHTMPPWWSLSGTISPAPEQKQRG